MPGRRAGSSPLYWSRRTRPPENRKREERYAKVAEIEKNPRRRQNPRKRNSYRKKRRSENRPSLRGWARTWGEVNYFQGSIKTGHPPERTILWVRAQGQVKSKSRGAEV